jgi:cytochrome b561
MSVSVPISTPESYTVVAKVLHWLIVLLVIVQFLSAWLAPGVRGDQSPGFLISIHMSFGITIMALMLVRFLWRITHAVPSDEDDGPRWQRVTAHLTHLALYGLLFVIPFLGWAWASSRGWTVNVLGIYTLPAILSKGSVWGQRAGDLHSSFAVFMLCLIGLHVLGAVYHRYIREDDVWGRMMPRRLSS